MTAERIESSQAHTVSHIFGEITWLLSQSWQHSDLLVTDLNWLVMPPILNQQFHIFRKAKRPVGAALWALFDSERQTKLEGKLKLPSFDLDPGDWKTGNDLWLIALIAPFANPENGEAEVMLADLIAGPFAQKPFRMIYTDPVTGQRSIIRVSENAKEELVYRMKKQILEAEDQR
ncbi:toxin-activating lysine-acyltransferase [Sphingomonas abietis]|uniref:RTX toxin-activating lysine-acyltransferase n=1 Tax=Sphingomonas abietis TaxID=3012344 RepID=A0ABY7NSB5_9SPHN|nr:toxin-activating lysine-acyltransferase [Sphingomonas abietis]WBO24459.1 toxin-activating lysine-acyltransferase [Sphingomonas abietis]